MAEPSPAPWDAVERGTGYRYYEIWSHAAYLASVRQDSVGPEICRANAELIRHAPDLLELARDLRRYITESSDTNIIGLAGRADMLVEKITGERWPYGG